MLSLAYLVIRWIFGTIAWTARSSRDQGLEIVVLRHQLEVLKRQAGFPNDYVIAFLAFLAASSARSRSVEGQERIELEQPHVESLLDELQLLAAVARDDLVVGFLEEIRAAAARVTVIPNSWL